MLIIILNLTLTRCFYEKIDEKKQALYDYNHFQSGWVLDYRLDMHLHHPSHKRLYQ